MSDEQDQRGSDSEAWDEDNDMIGANYLITLYLGLVAYSLPFEDLVSVVLVVATILIKCRTSRPSNVVTVSSCATQSLWCATPWLHETA